MCGRETLTTVVSRTSMKVESITAMAMIHGLMCAGFCCDAATDGAAGGAGGLLLLESSDGMVVGLGRFKGEVYTRGEMGASGGYGVCSQRIDYKLVANYS